MTTTGRWALGVVAALALGGSVLAADPVPEPDGYRLNAFRAPVPATLLGKPGLTVDAAIALWEAGDAVFVDVFPKPPKPAKLPEGTLWIDPTHNTIPGATWLPNTGYGKLTPDTAAYLARNMDQLTDGDPASKVVFFCLAECWMSWNAARRAAKELGYVEVYWFPDGTDGWEAAGRELENVSAAE